MMGQSDKPTNVKNPPNPNSDVRLESNKHLKHQTAEEVVVTNSDSRQSNCVKVLKNIPVAFKSAKSSMDLPINPGDQLRKHTGTFLTNRPPKHKLTLSIEPRRKTKDNSVIENLETKEFSRRLIDEMDDNSDSNTKSSHLIKHDVKFNSDNSNIHEILKSSNDVKLKYVSEYRKPTTTSKGKKEVESSDFSEDKNNNKIRMPNIQSKYSSNNCSENAKGNIDGYKMPLIVKETSTRKELTSVRLSLHPKKPDNNTNKEDISPSISMQQLKTEAKKRNTSIFNVTKERELEVSEVAPKRSKSENYSINRTISEGPIKDIISFLNAREGNLPSFENAKVVAKKYGHIESFVVNTHKGCVRSYNEDRVSILLNAQNKILKTKGTKADFNCSMFSVFDGHGGTNCCNYLKDNLHNTLLEYLDIEGLIIPSIRAAYKKIDEDYINIAKHSKHTFAGSCANTLLVINDSLMVINTGDSRTILSSKWGSQIIDGSVDHKPDKLSEFHRIIESGGELYRMSSNLKTGQNNFYFVKNYSQLKKINELQKTTTNLFFGPWRVKPGGLSVSRSFGDLESKCSQTGVINSIVTSEPDVTEFDISGIYFAFIACKLNS